MVKSIHHGGLLFNCIIINLKSSENKERWRLSTISNEENNDTQYSEFEQTIEIPRNKSDQTDPQQLRENINTKQEKMKSNEIYLKSCMTWWLIRVYTNKSISVHLTFQLIFYLPASDNASMVSLSSVDVKSVIFHCIIHVMG